MGTTNTTGPQQISCNHLTISQDVSANHRPPCNPITACQSRARCSLAVVNHMLVCTSCRSQQGLELLYNGKQDPNTPLGAHITPQKCYPLSSTTLKTCDMHNSEQFLLRFLVFSKLFMASRNHCIFLTSVLY